MSGLFSTFNLAKRGMFVQQKTIDVTSHNIANANTEGYSRQRANIVTTRPFGMPTMNNSSGPGQLGTGAEISSVERVRDAFLDFQVRVETSTHGQYDARQKFLGEIESIINEPSDTGLSSLIGKFFDSWQQLSKQPQSSNARTVVAQQAAALSDDLNHSYSQLNKLKENTQSIIKDTVFDVNNLLNQIDQLNQQIIGVRVSNNMPNDLMDKRDLLLDQLSTKFNINIDKKSFEAIEIRPVETNGISSPMMVKAEGNLDVKRLSYISSIEKNLNDPSGTGYLVTYYKLGDMSNDSNKMTIKISGLDDQGLKEMEQSRVIWTNSEGVAINADGGILPDGASVSINQLPLFQPSDGELKGYMSIQKDIDGYMDQLNNIAKAMAFSVNAIHSGMTDTTSNGVPVKDFMPFFVNKHIAQYGTNNSMINLDDTLRGEQYITAENISINKDILNDVMKIKTRTHDNQFNYASENDIDGETDGARALAIAGLRDTLIKVQDIGISINERKDLFDSKKGGNQLTNNGLYIVGNINGMKIDNYYKDTVDRLGIQSQEAIRMVKNQQSLLDSLNESRQSVSGVSLDEEMANLVQFQHAYQANAKVIATIDQLLDVVVNGLIR